VTGGHLLSNFAFVLHGFSARMSFMLFAAGIAIGVGGFVFHGHAWDLSSFCHFYDPPFVIKNKHCVGVLRLFLTEEL
jgi:hypothetical protein